MNADHAPVEMLGLIHHEAETSILDAMRRDTENAVAMAQMLQPADFYDTRRSVVFEAIVNLLRGIEPIDDGAIVAECRNVAEIRNLDVVLTLDYVESLRGEYKRATMYANTVRKLAWLRQAGDFAYWLVQELQARPNPDDLFAAAQERWQVLRPQSTNSRWVYGWETVADHDELIRQRIKEAEAGTLTRFDWPWHSWNMRIRPLRPGMVGIIAAPDGIGKTTYLEMVAEHWANVGINVAYVHLEDNLDYKKDRRLARHSGVHMEAIEDGRLTKEQYGKIRDAQETIEEWAGCLHYYDAAGESMHVILRELETKIAEGVCQAVVFDYLDKVQPTRAQSQLFGDNLWERQANDMEALKTFAERNKIPVLTATQGNKSMQGGGTQTRRSIQGSGQKSQKAQLVVILTRDIVTDSLKDNTGRLIAEEGEYSPIVNVRIDKQNRGRTGQLQQFLVGQFFRVHDINGEPK